MRPRIFFVGASGTGKTTMGRFLARELGLPFLAISPTEVYKRHGTTIAECLQDRAKMIGVQADVATYTAETLEAHAPAEGYVTDRAFDLSVYGALLGTPHPESAIRRILDAMHAPGGSCEAPTVRVVFVRPNPRVLHAARMADEGRRVQFLTDAWVYRVDGALAHFIASNAIPAVEVPEGLSDFNERMQLVRTGLGAIPTAPLPSLIPPGSRG